MLRNLGVIACAVWLLAGCRTVLDMPHLPAPSQTTLAAANALFAAEKYLDALAKYDEVAKDLDSLPSGSRQIKRLTRRRAECLYHQAQIHFKAGEMEEAMRHGRHAMVLGASDPLKPLERRGPPEDLTVGQSDRCSLHDAPMRKTKVPVVYGLPRSSDFEEMNHSKTNFPHGRTYLLYGCHIGYHKNAIIYRCRECEAERTQWVKSKGYEEMNRP